MLGWNHFLCFIELVLFRPVLLNTFKILLLPLRRKSFLVSSFELIYIWVFIFIYIWHVQARVGCLSEIESCWVHSVWIREERVFRRIFSHILPPSSLPPTWNKCYKVRIILWVLSVYRIVIICNPTMEWLSLR